jgi:hypothetical protein
MEKKITPPDGFEFKFINESEVQLVPKQSKYPMSIKDIKREYYFREGEYNEILLSGVNTSDYSSKFTAKKFAAMIQLKELCDEWNRIDNFTPKFDGSGYIWIIYIDCNNPKVGSLMYQSMPLAFKDRETAELFLNTFRDLIEQAGDLV